MSLSLVHEAATPTAITAAKTGAALTLAVSNPEPDGCSWVTPQSYEAAGVMHVRFQCRGCGATGGEAFGPVGTSFLALLKQAGKLAPHGVIEVGA